MKLYKMMFFMSMITGTLIAVSSYSWLSMWMGMEINLLSVIPLFSKNKNLYASESSMKYFITQSIASLTLLMSVIMILILNEFINPQMNFWFSMIMNSALLTKLGAAPFHFWFPEVMEGLSWMNCLILLTWQKIAPMAILMNNKISQEFVTVIMISCLIISTTMAVNQISLRKLMAFSSINHIAWMLAAMSISTSTLIIYFSIYCLMNLSITTMFKISNSFFLNQLCNSMNKNKLSKTTFILNFLSLGGLPPFLGFLPKWIIVNWMTNNNMFFMAFIMIVFTLIMLFVYVRITFSSILLEFSEAKISPKNEKSNMLKISSFVTIMGLISSTLIFNLL